MKSKVCVGKGSRRSGSLRKQERKDVSNSTPAQNTILDKCNYAKNGLCTAWVCVTSFLNCGCKCEKYK